MDEKHHQRGKCSPKSIICLVLTPSQW